MIYDAPLLIENGLHRGMDGVVLVVAPLSTQIERLLARNGLDGEKARSRIAAQMPLDEKRRFATWIIDNGGSLEETKRQVDRVIEELRTRTRAGGA